MKITSKYAGCSPVISRITDRIEYLQWAIDGAGDNSSSAIKAYEEEIKFLKNLLKVEEYTLSRVKEWKDDWTE